MKKWPKRIVSMLLSAAIGSCSLFSAPVSAAVSSPPYVRGIFIVPELSSDTTAEEWEQSLQNMADIGVDTAIIQYSFQTDSSSGNQAYFDYWQQDTVGDAENHPSRRSQIGRILAAAQKADIQVYLGLQLAEREWFDGNGYQNYDWLYHHYWLSTDLANALWDAFGETYADTIAGWYLPFEFESTDEYKAYFSQLTQVYYGPTTAYLKGDARFGGLPIMISPLMYWNDNKNDWQNNLQTVLNGSQIDILAPQDGIGYGTQTHATVGDWYRVCRDAVNAVNRTGKSVQLWGNCENYSRLRNPNEPLETERIKPMAIQKFIDSMNIAAPYVDNLITFSIHRWDTVQYYNREMGVNHSYYEAYKRYYQTGIRSVNIADGYFVSLQGTEGIPLVMNPYANAGLTDGLASGTGWDQFKGISSGEQSFTMEIRFDDPTVITSISSHYYQDGSAGIALPQQVVYEYMVRSGNQEQILTYTEIGRQTPTGSESTFLSTISLSQPVQVDGIRITVTPGGEWTFLDDIWILDCPYTPSLFE